MCWFGNRALPFAILVAATGAAIQKAIKSFGGQGKAIVLQEKHEQDFVHKVLMLSYLFYSGSNMLCIV